MSKGTCGKTTILSAVLLAAVISPAFAGRVDTDDHGVPVEVIDSGQFSGVTHQMSMVIRDAHEFEMLWMHHRQGVVAAQDMPKIDFEYDMVIASFLGITPTCGYDVTVTDIDDEKYFVRVRSVTRVPKQSLVCLVATQPYEFVKVPRINKVAAFEQKVRLH